MRIQAPSPATLREAADLLRAGELVVFPTETVYGLGANGLDAAAVRRIFAAKGRPADNPVILHVSGIPMAQALTAMWPEPAARLAAAFWPGPLTLVLPRHPVVPLQATGGLGSVAVRQPDHPVAQALIAQAQVPIAAPSANRSGRPSPTRVADAAADLGSAAALYLDGGPTRIGLESTIVSLAGPPTLLREGGVTRAAIEAVVGRLALPPAHDRPLAPGMKYRHYAPQAHLQLVAAADLHGLWLASMSVQPEGMPGGRTAWLVSEETAHAHPALAEAAARAAPAGSPGPMPSVVIVGPSGAGDVWAHRIFALLRDCDRVGFTRIIVEEIPPVGVGAAVLERLRKAAQG